MVKVRTPKIDDWAEKVKILTPAKKEKKAAKKSKQESDKGESTFDNSLEKKDEPMLPRKDDADEEEKRIRTMLRLDDFDAIISLFGIETIERKMRFVEKPTARWQYGIAINGGMEPSQRYPKTDLYAWYENMEVRDKRYCEILAKLNEVGIKIIQL